MREEESGELMEYVDTSEFEEKVSPGSFLILYILGKYSALERRAQSHPEHTVPVSIFPSSQHEGGR